MKKIDRKGFTLIELLAVIVIMGILMMVAIPAVSRIIENSRKDTFVDIAKSYVNSVRTSWTADNLLCGSENTSASAMDDGDYYVLIDTKNDVSSILDQGGKSSWGNRDVKGYVRVNVKTEGDRKITKYYVALTDGTHGVYDNLSSSKEADKLVRGDVLMNLNATSESSKLTAISTTPFENGKVTTCSSEGGNWSEIIPEPVSFSTDTWKTIAKAVKSGTYLGKYSVGDTKEVDMGSFGKHTVRISNMSNFDCQGVASQTTCGFVLEFADIIEVNHINPAGMLNGVYYANGWNIGGWPSSSIYKRVNTDIYNALPRELREVIIDTKVVSGHGSMDTSNFVSYDKLFLLSVNEVYGMGFTSGSTSDGWIDKQLDWYRDIGKVTRYQTAGAIKKYRGSNADWYFRTVNKTQNHLCYYVYSGGSQPGLWTNANCNAKRGISPAFRIG